MNIFLIISLSITFPVHSNNNFYSNIKFPFIIDQHNFLKELKMCLHKLSLMDDTTEVIDAPKKCHG